MLLVFRTTHAHFESLCYSHQKCRKRDDYIRLFCPTVKGKKSNILAVLVDWWIPVDHYSLIFYYWISILCVCDLTLSVGLSRLDTGTVIKRSIRNHESQTSHTSNDPMDFGCDSRMNWLLFHQQAHLMPLIIKPLPTYGRLKHLVLSAAEVDSWMPFPFTSNRDWETLSLSLTVRSYRQAKEI